ncbi:MAG TPA: DUF6327 family protein [Gillisia sp.]|nr:DUF6327 family protein [Gillisia sp.]
MKEYSSFEEIERDIKILKLQNQIDKEQVKLSIEQTKEALSPLSLLGSSVRAAFKKVKEFKAVVTAVGKQVING